MFSDVGFFFFIVKRGMWPFGKDFGMESEGLGSNFISITEAVCYNV